MKKYTENDLSTFERDEYGRLICPSGDYTQIKEFGAWCRFGEGCRFGAWCRFGEGCRFEGGHEARTGYPFMAFIGAGSRAGSKVYFYNCDDGIIVRCGCWCSNIDEFRQRVKDVNADPLYLDFANLAEKRFADINAK